MDTLDGLIVIALVLVTIGLVITHQRLASLERTMKMVIHVQNELGVMISKGG